MAASKDLYMQLMTETGKLMEHATHHHQQHGAYRAKAEKLEGIVKELMDFVENVALEPENVFHNGRMAEHLHQKYSGYLPSQPSEE